MRYYVERGFEDGTRWVFVMGSEGNRSYATGWYHALTSLLPRPAYRLVAEDGSVKQVDRGRGPVTTSQGGQRPA